MQINTRTELNDGYTMPLFGLGVYRSAEGAQCRQAVQWALEAGYRLIDTAAFYDNEASVGEAIRACTIPREELFVTTKLWNSDQGYDACLRAFDVSMDKLGLDYIDLYLIHYPVPGKRLESWRALEQIRKSGRCRSIGVSNYLDKHLQELLDHSNVVPSVNQLELSPYCFESRKATVDFCRQYQITLQAYSPLVRTKRFDDPKLVALAQKYSKTPAQILLRWGIQERISVIPKSSNRERIIENAAIYDFEISPEDMRTLYAFDENFIVCWNPAETA